ncbi:MAG: sigma-70 family RNA polymerase sigma factor [Myxococcales bacterium]|nr:sigma-70 family RNA polymerase sigma factor [Myxococcales bacterium]
MYPRRVTTDAELLRGWGAGDRDAGSRLFEKYLRPLHRFFSNKLASPSDVDDLVQQTFAACVASRHRYRADSSFRTYLYGIARNVLLKHLARRRRRHGVVASLDAMTMSLADLGLGQSTALGLRHEQALLLRALRHIPIDSQIVLEIYYWEEMTARQVAEVLDVTEPAVRARLRKAKAELRGALERLARTPAELDSTRGRLDEWIDTVRRIWYVGEGAPARRNLRGATGHVDD